MDKVVRVGLGVMIRNGDKILLGHRSPKRNEYKNRIVGHYLVENKKCLKQCLKVQKEK